MKMKILPPEPVITDEEGFSKSDIFGRKELAEGLTNVLLRSEDPLVIALDGAWGTGKTTFLKMWAGELRREGVPVVQFDAFAHDYMDDAFVALASAIVELTDEAKKDHTTPQRFKSHAVNAARILVRASLKLGVKTATMGLLNGEEFEGVAKDAAAESAKAFDDHIGALITAEKHRKQVFDQFKEALGKLPAELSGKNTDSPPLILIIDELDRCKPSFALEMLERIKHFFSVPNVHFVLGVNIRQLEALATSRYGLISEPGSYLQKFISLTAIFSEPTDHHSNGVVFSFVCEIASKSGPIVRDLDLLHMSRELLVHWGKRDELSLRTIQKIMTRLTLVASSFNPSSPFQKCILVCLCYLNVTQPAEYERARKGLMSRDQAKKALRLEEATGLPTYYSDIFKLFTPGFDPDVCKFYGISDTEGSGQDIITRIAKRIDGLLPNGQ